MFSIEKELLLSGINIVDLLGEKTAVFPSKGEVKRMIKGGGLSVNKSKIEDEALTVGLHDLLNNSYILVQKGKKNYSLITVKN
jgi:tyrosyl-tRNA synthetase